MAEEKAPERSEVIKGVRVLGAINLVLGVLALLGLAVVAKGTQLPGVAGQLAKGFGVIIALVAWLPALLSGIGLLMTAPWGRTLGLFWGRIIVWVLPVGFGLSAGGLRAFISIEFAIIIGICFYGNIVAQNLKREEFDVAFE